MARTVEVVDYDPAWPERFRELRDVLAATLGELAVAIEHVGSTSVPGLAAKPILDIDVVIQDWSRLPETIAQLGALGYRHEGDRGVIGREAFDWGEHRVQDGSGRRWPEHHLYVCTLDSDPLRRHVALRDWLCAHDEDRDRYSDLERRLALTFRDDRPGSCDAKTGFIEAVLTQALGEGFCTARAVVRPFSLVDVPRAHPVFADPEVMRHAAGDPDADLAGTRARLEGYERIQAEHGFSKWAVWDRESGAYLGDAGLTVLSDTGEVELGYRLGRSHWGRGLATEIARAWLEHAIGSLGIDRVIAFADPRNPASVRVMEKIGMTFHRRDHLAGMDCIVYETFRGSPARARRGRT